MCHFFLHHKFERDYEKREGTEPSRLARSSRPDQESRNRPPLIIQGASHNLVPAAIRVSVGIASLLANHMKLNFLFQCLVEGTTAIAVLPRARNHSRLSSIHRQGHGAGYRYRFCIRLTRIHRNLPTWRSLIDVKVKAMNDSCYTTNILEHLDLCCTLS